MTKLVPPPGDVQTEETSSSASVVPQSDGFAPTPPQTDVQTSAGGVNMPSTVPQTMPVSADASVTPSAVFMTPDAVPGTSVTPPGMPVSSSTSDPGYPTPQPSIEAAAPMPSAYPGYGVQPASSVPQSAVQASVQDASVAPSAPASGVQQPHPSQPSAYTPQVPVAGATAVQPQQGAAPAPAVIEQATVQSQAFASVTGQDVVGGQQSNPQPMPSPYPEMSQSSAPHAGMPQTATAQAAMPQAGAPQAGYAPQPGISAGQYLPQQQMAPQGAYQAAPRPKQKIHPLFIIGGVALLTIILLFAGCTFFISKLTSTISDTPKQSYEGAITTGPAPDDGPKATDLIAKELKVSPDKIKVDPSTSQEVKNGRYEHVKFDVDLPLSAFANNPNNPGAAQLGNATIPVTIECEGFAPEALIAEKMTVSYSITPQMYDEFNKAYMGVMEATSERSSTKLIDGGVHIETARAVGKDEIVTSFDLMISIAPDGNLKMEPRNGTNKSSYNTTDVTNDLKDMYSGSQPFNLELGAGRLKYTEFNISPSGIKVKRTGDHVHIGELVTTSTNTNTNANTGSNANTNTNTNTNTSGH